LGGRAAGQARGERDGADGQPGHRIYKESKHSTRRIDLAVAAVMAYATATVIEPGPQLFVFD
jgi:hypothetical protein